MAIGAGLQLLKHQFESDRVLMRAYGMKKTQRGIYCAEPNTAAERRLNKQLGYMLDAEMWWDMTDEWDGMLDHLNRHKFVKYGIGGKGIPERY